MDGGRHEMAQGDPETRDAAFCVLDCELTGLDRGRDEVISIGAVEITDDRLNLGHSFYRILRPEHATMTREAVLVHHLSHDRVAAGEDPETVLDAFLAFVNGKVPVGHYVDMDLFFLNQLASRYGRQPIAQPALDTVVLQRWYLSHTGADAEDSDLHLEAIARQMGLPRFPAHHALHDALTTGCLFLAQMATAREAGYGRLSQLLALRA